MPVIASDPYDEAHLAPGEPRDHYEPLLAALAGTALAALDADVADTLARDGATFGGDGSPFRVDPVPRLLTAEEWAALSAGLGQRVRALDRFVSDIYGPRRIVRDGVVPDAVVRTASYFEPVLEQVPHENRAWITIAGVDVVRCPDGAFRVLEDNVRTPSGIAYAITAREAVQRHVAPAGLEPAPLDASLDWLDRALHAAAPDGVDEPVIAVLTDGPANTAYFDHLRLADRLGHALVRPGDLRLRDGSLWARTEKGVLRLDVVYRRTDEDRLTDERGELTPLAALLLEPWARGRLGLVNAFGTGVADDKLIHAHVEDMVRFYLDEEPLIESVPTWDLSQPGAIDRAVEQLEDLVVKPRDGYGGMGVVIGSAATPEELALTAAALRANPSDLVVQDTVPLSLHPTIRGGRLVPRHVDLRPFVFLAGDEPAVMPGGLTRVAFEDGEMVVNSSRNGGAKDTWVVP